MAVLGLRFCARAFSSCGKREPLFIAVHGPLTVAASLVAEHRLQTRRLSNCGSRAQPLRRMWDPPRPGLEPVSPALAGRFSTTAPPGKSHEPFLNRLPGKWWEVVVFVSNYIFLLGRIYLPVMNSSCECDGSMFALEAGHRSRVLAFPEWITSLTVVVTGMCSGHDRTLEPERLGLESGW